MIVLELGKRDLNRIHCVDVLVYKYYKNLDWNVLNHHMKKAKPINVKKLVNESLGS